MFDGSFCFALYHFKVEGAMNSRNKFKNGISFGSRRFCTFPLFRTVIFYEVCLDSFIHSFGLFEDTLRACKGSNIRSRNIEDNERHPWIRLSPRPCGLICTVRNTKVDRMVSKDLRHWLQNNYQRPEITPIYPYTCGFSLRQSFPESQRRA